MTGISRVCQTSCSFRRRATTKREGMPGCLAHVSMLPQQRQKSMASAIHNAFCLTVRQIQPMCGKSETCKQTGTANAQGCAYRFCKGLGGERGRCERCICVPSLRLLLRCLRPRTAAHSPQKWRSIFQTRTPCNVPTIGTLCATRSRPAHPSGKQVHQSAAYRRGAGRGPRSELPHPVDRLHSWHRFTELIQGPSAF